YAAPYAIPMSIGVILWGGANFAFGSPLQSRMLLWAADAPNLTSALIPAGFNIGIAIRAVLGAGLLDAGWSYQFLPLIGAVSLAMATVIAILSGLWERRSHALPPMSAGVAAE